METDRKRAYQLAVLADALAEQLGWDGPNRVHLEADLEHLAEGILEAQAHGRDTDYTLYVVPMQEASGWTYRSFGTDDPLGQHLGGCVHHVKAATRAWACITAVQEHRGKCIEDGRDVS